MAVRIRLARRGGRNEDRYRVVVADRTSPRDGRFIQIIGTYNPGHDSPEKKMTLDIEKAKHWISVGAQPSELVRKYFGILGLLPPVDFTNRKKRLPKGETKVEVAAPESTPPQEKKEEKA